ncbi:conserved protein, unknown function [Hepatocystis sp. ex Piliocolobus tephrosceles]|nr:conserved protein, unknown function [Hepatocystis sp. ex Piliocolobus tephrosceles]
MDVNDNPFIKNRSSTRVTNAPGGNSSVSFGNYTQGDDENFNRSRSKTSVRRIDNTGAAGNSEGNRPTNQTDKKTNVKVNQPPGGASSST